MILLATVIRQVIKQAQSVGAQGVSAWLFLGQATASALFVIYAILLDNWVFIITNSFFVGNGACRPSHHLASATEVES